MGNNQSGLEIRPWTIDLHFLEFEFLYFKFSKRTTYHALLITQDA